MPSIRDCGIKQNAHMFVTSNWNTLSRKLCNYSEELMNNMGGMERMHTKIAEQDTQKAQQRLTRVKGKDA